MRPNRNSRRKSTTDRPWKKCSDLNAGGWMRKSNTPNDAFSGQVLCVGSPNLFLVVRFVPFLKPVRAGILLPEICAEVLPLRLRGLSAILLGD